MGKRSNFPRIERDCYDTPPEAVRPLVNHLSFGDMFIEPCAGRGDLVRHLEAAGMSCQDAFDIEPRDDWINRQDALDESRCLVGMRSFDYIITNPPWRRDILHPMIERFTRYGPTWLLFDADWLHTKQSAPFMPRLRKIVSVGRVKWIPGSTMTGKDNCCWYLFDKPEDGRPAKFYGRGSP